MITYRILPDQRLIMIWHRGDASLAEFMLHVETRRADPAYSEDFDMLTDVSGLDRHYTSEELRRMADATRRSPGDGERSRKRNAIVASRDATFGLSRMYEMLSEPNGSYEVRVFRTLAEAVDWLGKDPGAISGPE